MKKEKNLTAVDSAVLLKSYEKYVRKMSEHYGYDETSKYNRLYASYAAIVEELKSRPGDQRRLLIPLLDHPDIGVRLLTAKTVFALVPVEALATIEQIAASKKYPWAGDAGMTLFHLEVGRATFN